MAKIHIVGPGVVGRATGSGFERFGHEVVYTDKGDNHEVIGADFDFICVPENVVEEVIMSTYWRGTVVVRSSVKPGTCSRLSKAKARGIIHNPEFLRESTAEMDFLDVDYAIIGYPHIMPAVYRLKDLYTSIGKIVHVYPSEVTEMAKIVANSYLAAQISFWNQVKLISDRLYVNSHQVARVATLDRRIGKYGAIMHGKQYGGKCLPKDIQQLIDVANCLDDELNIVLLKSVQAINNLMPTGTP